MLQRGQFASLPTSSPPSSPALLREDILALRAEDAGWRSIGTNSRRINSRELPESVHDKHIELSFLAYRRNPLAWRLIEMQVNFILGNGISLSSDNPPLLAYIYQWWTNEWNNWPLKIQQRLRDLFIYGEWVHKPTIGRDGMVYISDIQPDRIARAHIDPINHSEVDTLEFKGSAETPGPKLPVIRKRLNPTTASLSDWSGDIFHFGINRTSDAARGVGSLFTIIDYLDIFDSILFARAEKIEMVSSIYFDLKLEGKSEQEIQEYLKTETQIPPKPGSVYAHNENAELQIMTPDLKADDLATDVTTMKSYIISSMGWPGTWFDDPGTAGRAVGAEMAEPALRNIVNLQTMVGEMLRREMDFAIWVAAKKGLLPEDSIGRDKYTISFNRPSSRDIARIGPAFKRIVDALEVMRNKVGEVVSLEDLRAIWAAQINQLGLSDTPMSVDLPTNPSSAIPTVDAKRAAAAQRLAAKNNSANSANNANGTDPNAQDSNQDPVNQDPANQESSPIRSFNLVESIPF